MLKAIPPRRAAPEQSIANTSPEVAPGNRPGATPKVRDVSVPEDFRVDHLWRNFAQALTQQENGGKIPTGLDEVDKLLGGGLPSAQVTTLCGSPGIGKTSLALACCVHYAKTGGRAVFWSLELPTILALARLVCQNSGVPWSDVLAGKCPDDVEAAGKALAGLPLYLTENRADAIIKSLLKYQDRPCLLVVDYTQLLATTNSKDQRVAVEAASTWLVDVAKSSGAAVLAISSTSRAAYNIGRGGKVDLGEIMKMARDTGRLEFDAAVVMGLVAVRQEGENEAPPRYQRGWLAVAKNRLGQRGKVAVEVDGQAGTVREVKPSDIAPAGQTLSDTEIEAEIIRLTLTQKLTTKTEYKNRISARAQRVTDGFKRLLARGRLVEGGRGKPFRVVTEGDL